MAEETTNPIDGKDMDAIAASLLETTPENPTEPEPEAVEETDVDQPETEEVVEQAFHRRLLQADHVRP